MDIKRFNLKKLDLNKTKILIITLIVTISVFLIGISYAYFQNQFGDDARSELEILSGTVDNLFFDIEKPLYINASVFNFGSGMENIQDDADATATLVPNNTTYEATASYNIYLVIEENELEYTTEEHTPELVFNVTDPNGNKVENITGLLHYENGFDITTRTGGFLIASDYVIEANNAVTNQVWNISIEFVNLDSNQNANLDKNFSAKIYMTTDKMSSYNPIQVTNIEANPTYNTVDTTLNLSNGTADVAKYYFGIEETNSAQAYVNNNNGVVRLNNKILASADTVEYQESDTPNYRFTSLKENTEYTIYSYVEDVNGVTSNVYETRVVTNEYRIPSVGEVTYSVTLNSITVNVNASGGDGNITKYMYSRNDGESWEESTSNTHTFTGLNDTTEYKIKIKVVDSNGRESTEYYKAISTETYILPVVASVDATTTYNSITLIPSGTDGTGTIDHYLYSIDNGEYQESNVFNNLNEQTEYTIRVKAIDNNGRETNPPYELQVTTDAYQVPTITNVTTSSTTNSITINIAASNGDGTISKYMYSRDNGSNWYESTSNSYTFSSLTSNTTFYVQVKVVDNNNRESAVSNTTVTTQYINPTVNSVSTSNVTSNRVTLTVSATAGSNSIRTYYYSNNNGSSYVSSSSNTYTFSGLSAGTKYDFRVYVVDSGGRQSNQSTTSATTSTPSLADVCSNGNNLASCIKTFYNTYGEGTYNLYYHNGSGSYTNANQEAGDNSYRYSGGDYQLTNYARNQGFVDVIAPEDATSDGVVNFYCNGNKRPSGTYCGSPTYETYTTSYNEDIYYSTYEEAANKAAEDGYLNKDSIKNYVCFGSTTTPCPEENLYRIIGVFGSQVKLIKNTTYGTYEWGDHDHITQIPTNYWNQSTVRDVLNNTYYNSLTSTWRNKIATYTWKVGGMAWSTTNIAKQYYNTEVGSSSSSTTDNMKVGLMYVSDYGYSMDPRSWTYVMYSYRDYEKDNWLVSGKSEWFISRIEGYGNRAFYLSNSGDVPNNQLITMEKIIRPTFYLNSNITYTGGTGTSTDPIRIN